jgi:hypothetical protein
MVAVLRMTNLEFRDTVRGMIPNRVVRYGVVFGLGLVTFAFCAALVAAVLTQPEFSSRLALTQNLVGLLMVALASAVLTTVQFAARTLENPARARIALLSPWPESAQLLARLVALLIVGSLPFALLVMPFLMAAAIAQPGAALMLCLWAFASLIWAVLLALLIVTALCVRLGRERGSRVAASVSSLLLLVPLLSLRAFVNLSADATFIRNIALVAAVGGPLLLPFSLRWYRSALLGTQEGLQSAPPTWGVYPWSRLIWRSRVPWFAVAAAVPPLLFVLSGAEQTLLWRSLALAFTTVLIAYPVTELLAWNRSHPMLWQLAPNRDAPMRQLIVWYVAPIVFLSLGAVWFFGVFFDKVAWALACTALLPTQLLALNFRHGKLLTGMVSTVVLFFVLFSPYFA